MLTFVTQALFKQHQVGSIAPSSRWLARAMTKPVRESRGTKRVLEVGPGTGAFTGHLLDLLRPGDALHLVECNPAFCQALENRLLAPFRQSNPDIEVVLHQSTIEEAPLEGQFDFVVCSLPFKIIEPAVVRAIFRRMMRFLSKGGQLTYFEYAGIAAIKAPLISHRARRQLSRVQAISRTLPRRHDSSRTLVWLNILPAFAVRLGDRRARHGVRNEGPAVGQPLAQTGR